jgi:hypothetical protein
MELDVTTVDSSEDIHSVATVDSSGDIHSVVTVDSSGDIHSVATVDSSGDIHSMTTIDSSKDIHSVTTVDSSKDIHSVATQYINTKSEAYSICQQTRHLSIEPTQAEHIRSTVQDRQSSAEMCAPVPVGSSL